MMKKPEVKRGALSHIDIQHVENGYALTCTYEDANPKTVGKRAGWVPTSQSVESYVAKTPAEVLKRLKEIL